MKLIKPSTAPANRRPRLLRATKTFVIVSLAAAINAHTAEAPPHNISAINIEVVQNDTGNTANSVTATPVLSINDMRVRPGSSRGDFNLQVGDTATNDLAGGLVLVSVTQNGRDNSELPDEQKNYAAPAFDGNANGYWCVIQDLSSDRAEYNLNCAAAYFRYTDWLCGWARNASGNNGGTNNFFTGSPGLVLGSHFRGISGGRSRVDLRAFGIYSTNSLATNTGVLLVNHAKNEGNYAASVANADGTWEIYVRDNWGSPAAGPTPTSLEQDPVAFVFVPKTNTTVVSGKFGLDTTGTNTVILVHSGNTPAFSVTNFAAGRYRLTIPGGSPAAGVLMVSAEGGYATNFDNVISYEADGSAWIVEARDTGVFPPALDVSTNEPVASFVYIPAATAGYTVTPTNTLVTTEFGLTASFNMQLDLAPTNDVTIDVTSSNPAEGLVSTNSLTFNATNWNIPQTITITGQDDGLSDGNAAYTVILAPGAIGDANYATLNPPDLAVLNIDDEQFGITVTPTSGLVTSETGTNATFVVFLNRQPANDVTFGVSSGNTGEGTVSTNSLTFSFADWSTPQIVTVTGVDDFRKDGNQTYTILTAAATSADLNYNGFNPVDVSVLNLDNDNPAILYGNSTPLVVAEGGTTTYSIVLATQPDSNVVVTVVSSDINVATVAPATTTFTALDWNTPRTITITGVDNLVTNGSTGFSITNTVASTDPLYVDFNGAKVLSGVRLDNETQVILPSGDCLYGIGMPAIGLDGQARVEDVDAATYNGGYLTVAITANGTAADRLEVRNTGAGSGQIGVSGTDVSYEGTVIGGITGGTNLTPLVIFLNANSTLPAAQQLIRSITFGTATNGASLATRTVTVTLNDGFVSVAASKSVRVGALRLTQYQESGDYGYGEYFGAADIALSEVGAVEPWPVGRNATEGLLIDWPDGGTPNASHVLLRFDDFIGTNTWQIPSNAVIVAAELLINVNNTGDGGRFYRMLIPWDATNDTWSALGDGVQADDIEARAVYESQLGVEDGSGATGNGIVSVGVTPDVQAWASGQTNYGWVMIGWPLRTDGTGFSPSEAANPTLRPRLRVLWLEPGFATASFRQGVNGYTAAFDTNLRQNNPDVNYATEVTLWSDANDAGSANNTHSLLRFDNIIGAEANQIPPGSLIHSAILEMPGVGPDAMGDGGQLHAMLQPWEDASATWNSFVDGIQANGVEAALDSTVVAGNSNLDPDVQGTINAFEVTADVQAWSNGGRPNYGWALLPWPGGNNGWGTRSADFVSVVYPLEAERERPRLRVYYTPSVFAAAAHIKPVLVTPTQVQVPFTGTIGMTYTVLRAATVSGPWDGSAAIGTATVGGNGIATLTDPAPLAGGAFYRVVHP